MPLDEEVLNNLESDRSIDLSNVRDSEVIKLFETLSDSRWTKLNKDAANRTEFSEYDVERNRQKNALRELLDEYMMAVGDDPMFRDIADKIKNSLNIDATAQSSSKYNKELKTQKQIMNALNKYLDKVYREDDNLAKRRNKLVPVSEDASEAEKKAYEAKVNQLIIDEERSENRMMAATSLRAYFRKLTNGNLEIPDNPKKVTLSLKNNNVEVTGDNKDINNYAKDDYTYVIDATGKEFLGGFTDKARQSVDDERVELKEKDATKIPLFPHDPCVNDIAQGGLGDCWFVNVIANLAKSHPEMIRDMMKDNGNGTVTVRLYGEVPGEKKEDAASSVEPPSVLKPVYVTVDKKIPMIDGYSDYVHGGENCLWVNMIERAAAAIGLGTRNKNKVLPPDYKARYEDLKKREKSLTKDDVEKNPWFFKDDKPELFCKYEPAFDAISGGRENHAIDMLMGPKFKAEVINTTFDNYRVELKSKKEIDSIMKNPAEIVNYAFKELYLSRKSDVDDLADIGLVLNNQDTTKVYSNGQQTNSYAQFDSAVDTMRYVETGDKKLVVHPAIGNRLIKVFSSNEDDLTKATNRIFKAEADEIIEEVKFSGDEAVEKAEGLLRKVQSRQKIGKNIVIDGDYSAYILEKLANKMKTMIDGSRKAFDNTIEGNAEMMKTVAKDFKKLSITKEMLEADIKGDAKDSFAGSKEEKVLAAVEELREYGEADIEKVIFTKYVNAFIKTAQDKLAASLEKLSGLQKKVTDMSEARIGTLFEKIQKGIRHNVILSAGVNYKELSEADKKTHLPVGHAYSIINAYVDEKGQRYITMRNPWGGTTTDNNGLVYDKKGNPKQGFVKDGVFDIKFEDFFGQIDDIGYNKYLDSLPDYPEQHNEPVQPKDILSSKMGHSFQCVIKDTYLDLLKTKTWLYKNTSEEFNDVIRKLKDAYSNISFSKEKRIDDNCGIKKSFEELNKSIETYKKHCEGHETSGKHEDRLKIINRLTDCLKNSITNDEVKDPRQAGMEKLAEKMIDSYYKSKNINAEKARKDSDIQKIISSTKFNKMIDDKNSFTLDKISSSEAKKMMKELIDAYKTPAAKENLGITV